MAPVHRHAVTWTEDGLRLRATICAGKVENIEVMDGDGFWTGLMESGIITTAQEMLQIAGRAMQVDREQHEQEAT